MFQSCYIGWVQSDAQFFVAQEKVQKNKNKFEGHVSLLLSAARSNHDASSSEISGLGDSLASRIENPLWKFGASVQGSGDKEPFNCQDVVYSKSVKLPLVGHIPPYTTWIFLDRYIYNHRPLRH